MAQDLLPPRERLEAPVRPSAAPGAPRRATWRDALVATVACLVVWTLLSAPILERGARTGPLGTRRTVALAVLRPIGAVSDALGLTPVAEGALRALGDDPDEQPGGELELPDLELPPLPPPSPVLEGPSRPEGARSQRGGHGGDRKGDGSEGEAGTATPAYGPVRNPTPNDPLRVAIVGDSLSQGLGASVERSFNARVARVLPLGQQSSGLSRQDYFNWPRAMREIEERFRPDVVFVMLGTNDAQPQIAPDGGAIPTGSTAWVNAYTERVASFLRVATSSGTRVVWVGLPVVRDHRRWTFYRRVNAIYRDVASGDPLATYVDTWEPFEARDGGFTPYLRNERGVVQEMRAPDGLHFTPTGYDYLARLAIRQADEAFEMPQRAVTFRLGGGGR